MVYLKQRKPRWRFVTWYCMPGWLALTDVTIGLQKSFHSTIFNIHCHQLPEQHNIQTTQLSLPIVYTVTSLATTSTMLPSQDHQFSLPISFIIRLKLTLAALHRHQNLHNPSDKHLFWSQELCSCRSACGTLLSALNTHSLTFNKVQLTG